MRLLGFRFGQLHDFDLRAPPCLHAGADSAASGRFQLGTMAEQSIDKKTILSSAHQDLGDNLDLGDGWQRALWTNVGDSINSCTQETILDDLPAFPPTTVVCAMAASMKSAKRKAATSVEEQPRQGKAARRLTSTFGDSARAGQVDFLLSILDMASSVQDFRDKACSTDAEITVDGDFKTLIDNVYAKCGQDLIKENMYKLIRTLDVFLTMRDEGIAEFKDDGCIIWFPFSSIKVKLRQAWDNYVSQLAQDFVRKYNKTGKTIKEPISTVYEIINMAGFRCKLSENPKIRTRRKTSRRSTRSTLMIFASGGMRY